MEYTTTRYWMHFESNFSNRCYNQTTWVLPQRRGYNITVSFAYNAVGKKNKSCFPCNCCCLHSIKYYYTSGIPSHMFKTEQIIKKVHIMDLPRDGATVALQYVQPGGTGRDTALVWFLQPVTDHSSMQNAVRSFVTHVFLKER